MTFHKSHGIKFLYLIHEITLLKKGERYGFVDGGERAAVEMKNGAPARKLARLLGATVNR